MFRRLLGYSRTDDANPHVPGSKAAKSQLAAKRAVLKRLRYDAARASADEATAAWDDVARYRRDNGLL